MNIYFAVLLGFAATQQLRKWDWENNYQALQCTCPDQCCIMGSLQVTDDLVMQTNFVKLSGKLEGPQCQEPEFNEILCILDKPSNLNTNLTCPLQNWAWGVTRDNMTGSIYWNDYAGCQGVWKVLNFTQPETLTLYSIVLSVGLVAYVV